MRKLSRIEFMSCIGYHGRKALINRSLLKADSQLDFQELLEKGLYKIAFTWAIYTQEQNKAKDVLHAYNKAVGQQYQTIDDLKRLFGVFYVPTDLEEIIYV